jgi:4-hydroxy-tetrahydrodipicolinate synthase
MVFNGLIAYPITPLAGDGDVNYREFSSLVAGLAESAVDAVTVLGSSGSSAYLSPDERSRVVLTAMEAMAGRKPVFVGVSAIAARDVLAAAREAERAGAAGLVLTPMSYLPLNEEEVAALVSDVCDATALPVCLYNNPTTTRFDVTPELAARLLELTNICGFKDTARDAAGFNRRCAAVRSMTAKTYSHGLSGDLLTVSGEIAADAWHSGPAAILPAQYAAFRRSVVDGDAARSVELSRALLPIIQAVQRRRGPSGLHALARACGVDAGDPRRPLLPAPGSEQRDLARLVDEAGWG